MTSFDDRIQNIPESSLRSQIIGYATAAGLKITNWRVQGVGNQILETVVSAVFIAAALVPTAIRGFASLDLSTDPGDEDDFDPDNEARTPGPGFLSNLGANTHGTTREEATFATGFVSFTNAGPGSRTIAPSDLVATWTGGTPPSPPPTYFNSNDPAIYVGGTVTVPAGTTRLLPIQCQTEGAIGSAPSSVLTLTTSLLGCSLTNADPILGNDREDADTYRARCRLASARLSLGGPAAAYEYLAAKNLDGTPLLNVSGVPTAITRAQVSQSSSTGIVNAYFGSASGPAISDDVTAANANIQAQAFAVPDAITYTGIAAISTTIHVQGTAKIRVKAGSGITRQTAAEAIVAALGKYFSLIPIGGVDQVAGAGVVYRVDIQAFARPTDPRFSGIYDLVVTVPAGDTAMVVGHIAVLQSAAGDGAGSADWNITLVSA